MSRQHDDRDTQPSAEGLAMLESLRASVHKALERKRRLGHYAVFWRDGKTVLEGEDAPRPEQDDKQP